MRSSSVLLLALSLFSPFATLAEPASDQVSHDLSALAERQLIGTSDYWKSHLGAGSKCDGKEVALLLTDLAKVFRPATSSEQAIAVLAERGVIASPDYWTKHALEGAICDGEKVAIVISRVVGRLPVPPPKSVGASPLLAIPAAQLQQSYDVVIAGAGTGGCGVAIQAARLGRSVLLLEETDWIGGQMNAAAVTSMDEGVRLVRERGLYRELCGHIAAYYQPRGINFETAYWMGHVCVEPRIGQRILQVLLGDARGSGTLDLVLRARVNKVLKSGKTVTGVEIEAYSAEGAVRRTITSKVLVDATEWGDVIPLTGARYRAGNQTSESLDLSKHIQDITWTAVVKQYPQGVPAELRVTTPPPGYDKLLPRLLKTLQIGKPHDWAEPPSGTAWSWDRFIGYRGMPDSSRPGDAPPITRTHLNFNNDYHATVADLENPASRLATCHGAIVSTLCLLHYIQTTLGKSDWSVANDEGYDTPYNRAQMDALIKEQPALEPYRTVLYQFPVMAYARESRRIIGLHTLTAGEIERKPGNPIQFPHTVALGDYAVDLHGSMKPEYLELDLDRAEEIPHKFGERGLGPFAIPFESFIPEKIDGFLAAEKNISQSRLANGATRLQPHTLLMGQAVGAIAALSIQKQLAPRDLDPALVQQVLLDAGCPLSILPVKARVGTPEWKAEQLQMLKPKAGSSAALFNSVVGTQTFGAAYQFTDKTRLVETAEAIHEMGANVIKFELSARSAGEVGKPGEGIDSLAKLARDEPSHRHVLDMPFANYLLWAHSFSGAHEKWRNGFSKEAQAAEYRELYDLTAFLLKTYSGSGKSFYLGHWEGDGLLRGSIDQENDAKVTPEAVQGMADWLNARQRAIDDAKRDTPHQEVQVWHYTEVNHVKLAMAGRPALVNEVLPKVPVDFVSYSSYDTQSKPAELKAALDFIESKLAPKPGITGKRVFIGEYGFPASRHTPDEQDRLSRQVMRTGLEWGCPFVLYWALYNNEIANGKQVGYWLINDLGAKQPVYFTHKSFLDWAASYLSAGNLPNGQVPSEAAFRAAAIAFLR